MSNTRALLCLLLPALGAAGCSSDKSFALVSVLSSGGAFNDVAQLRVDVRNDPFFDALAYPKERKPTYRFDETQALTFSIGYRNSTHAGTLVVGVTPVDAAGAPLGYGEGTAQIVSERVTNVTVRVVRGASPPVRADGGAADARPDASLPPVEAGPPCDPTAPTVCSGGTCFVSCRADDTAVGMCTMAGTKNPGELCTQNEECVTGSQCFEFACAQGKPTIKTCLRFCKDSGQCGAGQCTTPIPCGGKATEFKACSQPCNPVGEATQGCAAGLNCFVFAGEVADCDCASSMRTRGDGVACETSDECVPGHLCVKMAGAMTCRPVCRLDAPTTCAAGRTCTKLVDPDYKVYGACLP